MIKLGVSKERLMSDPGFNTLAIGVLSIACAVLLFFKPLIAIGFLIIIVIYILLQLALCGNVIDAGIAEIKNILFKLILIERGKVEKENKVKGL